MTTPTTLNDRIGTLFPDINKDLREGLQMTLSMLRDSGIKAVPAAIVNVSRLMEGSDGLLGAMASASGRSLTLRSIKGGLNEQIKELTNTGLMPEEIASDIVWIRVRANKARHYSEEKKLTINDAEIALDLALHVVEWFYCKYEYGMGLSSIYSGEYHFVTAQDRITELQNAFAEQFRSLQSEIAHLNETLQRKNEEMKGLITPPLKKIAAARTFDEEGDPHWREGADPSRLIAEQDKLLAAFPWALSQDTRSALNIAYELSISLDLQGHRDEALKALDKALDLVLVQGQDAPKELQFKVLNRASHLAIKQAYCDEGERFAQKMLELSREVKQDANKAIAFQRLGKSKYFRCDSEVARELLEESLSIFQNLEDSHGVAWVQFDLGMLEVNQNNFASARCRLEGSLALHQNNLDKIGEGTVRVNLAFVLHKQGEREAAYAHMAKAEELLEGNSYFRWYLHFLARLEIAEGNVGAARDHLRESLKIFRDRRDELGILRSLLGFGWLAVKREKWERAIKLLGAEEARRQEMKTNWPEPPDWKTERDFITTGAREALGEVAFNVALAKGKAMTWEQAIEYSLN